MLSVGSQRLLSAQELPVAPVTTYPNSRARFDAAARELATTTADLARAESESHALDAEFNGIEPRRAALRVRARQEIRWLYHMVQGGGLAARGGPEMLLDHASRESRLRRVVDATLHELDDVAARTVTLAADRARVAQDLRTLREQKTRLETATRAMTAAYGPRYATGAPAETESVTVYGGAADGEPGAPGTFAASAGRLLFPVAGRAEVRRVYREGAEGPGVEITVPLGSPVRATFPGRVAFADRYGSYGPIVIVDHGDHYYTVSAGLGRVDVHVGDEVTPGTVLGTVGEDPGRGPLLYFEVRHGGETQDPVPWLGM